MMNNHKPLITAGQLFVLLFVSRLALTMLYSSALMGITSLWEMMVPLLLWIPSGLILLWPSVGFSRRGISVCDYSVRHFHITGKVLSVLYGAYFLGAAFYCAYLMKRFMTDILPQGVSVQVMLVFLIAGCIYAAGKDIEAIARTAFLVLWLLAAAVLLMVIFLLPGYSSAQLSPVYYLSGTSVIDGWVLLIGRMGSMAALPTLIPCVKGNIRRSAGMYMVCFSTVVIFLIVLLTGSTGNYLKNQQFPIFRAIDGSAVLQRLDPLFILVVICSLFCHVTLLLLSFGHSMQAVFSRWSISRLTVIGGVFLIGVVLLWPDSGMVLFLWPPIVPALMGIFFVTVVPGICWLHQRHKEKKSPSVQTRKSRWRIASFFSLVLCLCLSVSGCRSLQLNQRMIVQGVGVDRQEDGYRLTLMTLDTRDHEKDNAMTMVFAEGKSVAKAVEKLENRSGKKLLMNQCLFVMMNRRAAGYAEKTLDYFTELRELPKTVSLMVSEEEAESTLLTAAEQFGDRSEDIHALSDSKAVAQSTVQCTLLEYIAGRNEEREAWIFPYVVSDQNSKALMVRGGYLVDCERCGCTLSEEETTGYLLVKGMCGMLYADTADKVQVTMLPYAEQERLRIDFHVLIEWKKGISAEQRQAVQQDITEAINACCQKLLLQNGCDVFSIEEYLRNTQSPLYDRRENMRQLLRNADYRIQIET